MLLRGEDRLISWLRRQLGSEASRIGDDGAVLRPGGEIVITVDQQIEGVHFLPGLEPALLARRLLRVNLSDLAAMGASPGNAFLALATPGGFEHRRFFRALLAESRRFGVRLAGGDLAHAATVHASLTLVGGRRVGGRWLRRENARPGDVLWVGGTLGEAAAGCLLLGRGAELRGRRVFLPGPLRLPAELVPPARRAVLRHLLPEPQLALSAWLAARRRAAALDVSDGLARDLHRLCRESGVGAEVLGDRLPLAPRAAELARSLDSDPLALAIGGGEDYVLLFALPPGVAPPVAFGCTAIGRITARRAVRIRTGGSTRSLGDVGFDHLASDDGRPPLRPPASARRPRRARAARRRPPG
jgi:thiamine-monophosphate kinase